jgi:hypothetical protein
MSSVWGGERVLVSLEDVFEPLFFVLPCVSLEGFKSFFGGGLPSREVSFPPFYGYCIH